jgi:hypothetical protein
MSMETFLRKRRRSEIFFASFYWTSSCCDCENSSSNYDVAWRLKVMNFKKKP